MDRFFDLFIIESTECSIAALKSVFCDNTRAGLLFVLEESVNGNGTTTTSNGSINHCRLPHHFEIPTRLE